MMLHDLLDAVMPCETVDVERLGRGDEAWDYRIV